MCNQNMRSFCALSLKKKNTHTNAHVFCVTEVALYVPAIYIIIQLYPTSIFFVLNAKP
jgi:hypothetical protein